MAQTVYASESRLLDNTHPDDPRILGNDRFLAQLPPLQFTPKSVLTLEQLAMDVCHARNLSLDAVRSPSRRRALTPVRIEIARRAIALRIATLREVADFFHRDASSLSELLLRYERTATACSEEPQTNPHIPCPAP
jgi:hypothetical protein